MSKKINAAASDLALKPSEASIAINHMIHVNIENAKRGKKRRGLFIWGPPGIAKSSIVEQIAIERNMKLIDIRLTQMEPTDLRGIPVPYKDDNGRGYVEWAVPEMLPKRAPGSRNAKLIRDEVDGGGEYDGAIILLDELPNAAPSVQAGSYQIVLDGELGEWKCPDNVVVIAAGNREIDKGSTFKMPTPLQNRFAHIEMKHDFDDFQTFALKAGLHPAVVGYLTSFKHELFQFQPTSAARGFPTPRSWEMVSDILRGDPNLPAMVQLALVAGAISDGIAVKFIEYRKNAADLPAASDILDGKVKKLNSGEVSLRYALTTSLCYELLERFQNSTNKMKEPAELKALKKKFNESADNFLGFMMENFQPEMVIMGARTAMAVFKISFQSKELENWPLFSKQYQDLIIAA